MTIRDNPVAYLLDWCAVCDDEHTDECRENAHGTVLDRADFIWEICDRCQGEGVLGGYPGAYTQSEFDELFGDDIDEYLNYRRPCEDCGGSGKVQTLSDAAQSLPAVLEALRDHWDTENTYRMERMMGA